MKFYLARDLNGHLFLYAGAKPLKSRSFWGVVENEISVQLTEDEKSKRELFPYVQFEDKEPTEVYLIPKECNDEKKSKQSILLEADLILNGDRQADYSDPVDSFERISKLVSILTGKEITADDCCKVLMAVKLVRESFRHKRDNLVDLCGYSEILNRIKDKTI